jgi:polyphosphate kinase
MNSLIDREIIEALYAASTAGVKIRLNIRGICALRPGVHGVARTSTSSRSSIGFSSTRAIYYFLNGGDDELYLASSDWMTRNLDRRVELMFPVEGVEEKKTALSALRAMFKDTVKARRLGSDGTYKRVRRVRGEAPVPRPAVAQADAERNAAEQQRVPADIQPQ